MNPGVWVRQVNQSLGIQKTEAKATVDHQTSSIPFPAWVVGQWIKLWGPDHNVLKVSPAQIRTKRGKSLLIIKSYWLTLKPSHVSKTYYRDLIQKQCVIFCASWTNDILQENIKSLSFFPHFSLQPSWSICGGGHDVWQSVGHGIDYDMNEPSLINRCPSTSSFVHSAAAVSYFCSSARAKIPAARGAEADVPVWVWVHSLCRSALVWGGRGEGDTLSHTWQTRCVVCLLTILWSV